jgi:hypothetical protein
MVRLTVAPTPDASCSTPVLSPGLFFGVFRRTSTQASTHSLQMKTIGPAISFSTSCWLFPQIVQKRVELLTVRLTIAPMPDASRESLAQRRTALEVRVTCEDSHQVEARCQLSLAALPWTVRLGILLLYRALVIHAVLSVKEASRCISGGSPISFRRAEPN